MTRPGRMLGASPPRAVRRAAIIVGVAAGYYLGSAIGTVLSVPPSGFAIIWPSTAFLIGVLLLSPPRLWALYLTGVIPAHALMAIEHGPAPLLVMASQVGGNIGLAVATALALNAVGQGTRRFDDFRSTLTFIAVGAFAVPGVGNVLILCLHLLTGWTDSFWLSWRQWMLASIFPTLTIPPVMALVFDRSGVSRRGPDMARLELSILCSLMFVTGFIVFGWRLEVVWLPVLALLALPLMFWAAVRFGVAETSLALLVLAAAIIVRALDGAGPFAVGASPLAVISLQVFLTALAVPLLLLSALNAQRRRDLDMLQRSGGLLERVAASTSTGLWHWNPATERLWMTDHCRKMLGLGPDEMLSPDGFLAIVHPDDRARIRAAMNATQERDVAAMNEFRVIRSDGAARWFVVRTHTDFDGGGEPSSISGVFRDITERVDARREADELGQRLLLLQEEERQKIAEQLRESTSQNLVAASLSLSALKRRLALSTDAEASMDETFASISAASDELRTFTYLLRPAGLDREGLCAVLRRHVEGFSRWTGLKATLRPCLEADRLPLEQQRTILRIVQESLINVHRHAGATRVTVRMRRVAEDLHLIIRDNGEGMPAIRGEAAGAEGVGIPGMTARVHQLSGRISIRSSGKGTVVHVAIPMGHAPSGSAGRRMGPLATAFATSAPER